MRWRRWMTRDSKRCGKTWCGYGPTIIAARTASRTVTQNIFM
jgi:hypothetical protein